MRQTPLLIRRATWRFVSRERHEAGGSVVAHVAAEDPRLERRRFRTSGFVPPVDVYFVAGRPCASPVEAATLIALAPPLPRPAEQLRLL